MSAILSESWSKMKEEILTINVVAISKKDEKKSGYGWIKFVPSDDKPFWSERVPGGKFNLASLGKAIDTNGIYQVEIKTFNPFGMPSFEIISAKYLGGASDLLGEKEEDYFNV